MIDNQYPYNHPAYIANDSLGQAEEQRKYWEQQKKIGDMVRAVRDYFNAARDIAPEYRQQAGVCCAEIVAQIALERRRNGGQQWQ